MIKNIYLIKSIYWIKYSKNIELKKRLKKYRCYFLVKIIFIKKLICKYLKW